MDSTVTFERSRFFTRAKSMLKVDLRRAAKSKLLYIILAAALVAPILMMVMTSMLAGSERVDPNTGEVTIVEEVFTNAWQAIGALPSDGETSDAAGGMALTSMCNIDMMFMAAAVFVCLFICEDFRSGYAKNLFSVRAKKGDYVISKTIVGFICGALLLLAYFVGAMIGGKLAGLPFELHGLTSANIVMCMLAKLFLMPVFVSLFTLISVAAKQKSWLAIFGSLAAGMLLFMMISVITPLSSTIVNVLLCFVGGSVFALGAGIASKIVLNKTALV